MLTLRTRPAGLWHQRPIRPYIAGMGTKKLPIGENTAGLNPDGTLAIGTPEQMRPLLEQWKRWQEAYDRGEIPDEPMVAVTPEPASEDDECRS